MTNANTRIHVNTPVEMALLTGFHRPATRESGLALELAKQVRRLTSALFERLRTASVESRSVNATAQAR